MTDVLTYQIERSGDAATLYLSGVVRDVHEITEVAGICHSLPPHVVTLRLDLGGVQHIGSDAMEAVGVMLCEWREQRTGEFRMFYGASRAAARFLELERPHRARDYSAIRADRPNEALTGTFL